jgi:hypothetical protein
VQGNLKLLNKTAKSEENDIVQKASSLASRGQKCGGLSRPFVGSGTGIKNFKPREEEISISGPRNSSQKSKLTANRLRNSSVGELHRSDLDRRVKTFNESLDTYKQEKEKPRGPSVEKPTHNNMKMNTLRSMSLPLVFQSYSDKNMKYLSSSEKNSYENLRHCRYLRIPAPPELSIEEIFRESKKQITDTKDK